MAREKANDNIPLRVAYHGGRHGMGSRAFSLFKSDAAGKTEPRASSAVERLQATADQAISAVINRKADAALLPFFSARTGYFPETVAALTRHLAVAIVGETRASDNFCLAVPIEHIRQRDEASFTPERARRGLALNYGRFFGEDGLLRMNGDQSRRQHDLQREQERWTTRITDIYASPGAERACATALSNYAAQGVKIRPLNEDVTTARDFLDLASAALDEERMVRSSMTPDGQLEVSNIFTGKARRQPVYGVIMPFHEAMHNEDLFIVEPEFEDGGEEEVRYVYVKPRGGSGWPFGVSSWDGGHTRLGPLPISTSGWWGTIARKLVGNTMIASGLKDFYRDRETLHFIITSSSTRQSGIAPSLESIEHLARRRRLRYESASVRLGDGAPAHIMELEIDQRDSRLLLPLIKRIRTQNAGFVNVLGGYATNEPNLSFRGKGRSFGEAFSDVTGL